MLIPITRFYRPDRRQAPQSIELADDLAPKLKEIQDAGCRLTADVLTTGMCSFTVELPALGDFDMELSPNDPEVPVKLTAMIRRFDPVKFAARKEEM